jgi:hypothetical protein
VRLLPRLRLAQWLAASGAIAAGVAGAQILDAGLLVVPVAGVGAWLAMRRVGMAVAGRAWRRFARRVDDGDHAEAHALLDELKETYAGSRGAYEQLRMSEATLLAMEGRHVEACALLESLDPSCLGKAREPWRLNNLAWSLALSGRPAHAVATARASMEASERAGDAAVAMDLRACQLGTLGVALVLAGNGEEGVPLLEQAIARGGRAWRQAAREFFRGEGLHARGDQEGAAAAWARAAQAAPKSEWAERANARLSAARAYRS